MEFRIELENCVEYSILNILNTLYLIPCNRQKNVIFVDLPTPELSSPKCSRLTMPPVRQMCLLCGWWHG